MVGRTGALGNSMRAPSEVMSRTKQSQTNEPRLGITMAGAEMRVRVTDRRSTIGDYCEQHLSEQSIPSKSEA